MNHSTQALCLAGSRRCAPRGGHHRTLKVPESVGDFLNSGNEATTLLLQTWLLLLHLLVVVSGSDQWIPETSNHKVATRDVHGTTITELHMTPEIMKQYGYGTLWIWPRWSQVASALGHKCIDGLNMLSCLSRESLILCSAKHPLVSFATDLAAAFAALT